MNTTVSQYLAMQRACYATLVGRSRFDSEAFTTSNDDECVVGSYARHEAFDYERWLFGGMQVSRDAVGLDYGCGPGRMLLRLADRFQRIDGVDLSPEVLEIAQRRTAHLPTAPCLFLTEGQDLPLELDGIYDIAYSVICLQHISVHSIRREILRGLYRALKPGGVLTFQMGYGPGHAAMVDYFDDRVSASATNGGADVTVLHPTDIARDITEIGFTDAAYALTPAGPGDTHAAWIFVRAVKPGRPAALVSPSPKKWASFGFAPLVIDAAGAAQARQTHEAYSITARVQQLTQRTTELTKRSGELTQRTTELTARTAELEQRLVESQQHAAKLERRVEDSEARGIDLETQIGARARAYAHLQTQVDELQSQLAEVTAERDAVADAGAFARAERDHWRARTGEISTERDGLTLRAEACARQLRRLRIADRRRLSDLINEFVAQARAANWRVGVFGAGEHTEWLFRETALQTVKELFVFDSNPAANGQPVGGVQVRPAHDIPALNLQAVVVSSLAFQDEMTGFLESLPNRDFRIVRCYP